MRSRNNPHDLLERIRLGFHCVTNMADPDRDFLPYWGLVYDGTTPLKYGRIDNCDTPFCWMEILLINRRRNPIEFRWPGHVRPG